MRTFLDWLQCEAWRELVPAEVLQGYEAEFRRSLEQLIQRTKDPTLREKFREMLDCPVRDRQGGCRGFAEYILSALVKHRIHDRYDIEAALSYVAEKMLMATTASGGERKTLFGSFEERPHGHGFNPLQARFLSFLQFAVNNIRKGKIPRLANVEPRPQGTVSIDQGRRGEQAGSTVSPEAIPARRSGEADVAELIDDLTIMLHRKERAYPLPLGDVFRAILAGQNTEELRGRYGDRRARLARQVIKQTVEEYGRSTGNYRLLNQLRRLQEPGVSAQATKTATVTAMKLPDKDRDYMSIVNVIDRLDRPVGSADLGKYRRRWLDYPPRNPLAGYSNRLEEVLAQMVQDGVLRAETTSKGATVYSPGPTFAKYSGTAAVS